MKSYTLGDDPPLIDPDVVEEHLLTAIVNLFLLLPSIFLSHLQYYGKINRTNFITQYQFFSLFLLKSMACQKNNVIETKKNWQDTHKNMNL